MKKINVMDLLVPCPVPQHCLLTNKLSFAGDTLMRGKRYGQLMIFSDIAATRTPPPFAIFCIDADVLTGWKDVDAMITTLEGTLLVCCWMSMCAVL